MNELERKILNALSYNIEMNMSQLSTKTDYWNRNNLIVQVKRLEKNSYISIRKKGRERLIIRILPHGETKKFVDNYGTTLKNYAKMINYNLKLLKKNMPLVPKNIPMKRIKTREPLIKSKINHEDQVIEIYASPDETIEGHAYTWRTRPKPLKYFNAILNSLNRLYQESSAISFSEFIDDDPSIKEYQKESKTLIKDTLDKFELIFKKDGKSSAYSNFYIKNTLYGLIHQIMLDRIKSKTL